MNKSKVNKPCPKCNGQTAVISSKVLADGRRYRRHVCMACKHLFASHSEDTTPAARNSFRHTIVVGINCVCGSQREVDKVMRVDGGVGRRLVCKGCGSSVKTLNDSEIVENFTGVVKHRVSKAKQKPVVDQREADRQANIRYRRTEPLVTVPDITAGWFSKR